MPGKLKNHPDPKYRGGRKKDKTPVLTRQQKKMVELYFGDCNFNKVQSAKQAGYKHPASNAWALFDRPAVRAEVARREELNRQQIELTEDWVLNRLIAIATANTGAIMAKLREHDYNLNCLTPDEQYCIEEFVEEVYMEGRGENAVPVKRVKLKLENNLAALDKLMRRLGLYKDSVELTGELSLVQRLQQGREQMSAKKSSTDAAD